MLQTLNYININFKKIRENRQYINYNKIFTLLKNKNEKYLLENCNKNKLTETLQYLNISIDTLLDKSHNDLIFAKTLSLILAKKSTRQGAYDELMQLNICNKIAHKLNYNIIKLNVNDYRPYKNEIIKDYANSNKKDCLKSFDAIILGNNLFGWIISKIIYGDGGHQDNVFKELYLYCEFAKKYKIANHKFILLIETNLKNKLDKLKNNYKNVSNILIVNHFEFQVYLKDNLQSQTQV